MKSKLNIQSNLIVDDESYRPIYIFIPGDYIGEIYPNKVDTRSIDRALTKNQKLEYEQYLVCHICKRPCAGTCEGS